MRWNLNAPSPSRPGRFWLAFLIAFSAFAVAFGIAFAFRNCGSSADARRLVRRGDVKALEAALMANPGVLTSGDPSHQASLLHIAVDANKIEAAKLLLRYGADVNLRDKYGMTALHKAAIFNRLEIARLLADSGADLNVLAPKYGQILVSPLHLAAEAGYADMIDVLGDCGADMNPQPPNGPVNPSPMHLAAAKGNYAAAKALLDNGAEPDPKDRNGRTPADWAEEMGQPEVAKLLQNAVIVRDNARQ